MTARPKFIYTRSPRLMVAYRAIPCQNCGREDGTVCGAHSNWSEHGKGKSIKASDVFCASLCSRCHMTIDQGYQLTDFERKAIWSAAHVKTVKELVKRKLWPDGIPVPEINGTDQLLERGLPCAI
jgi:hypothetical protein